MYIVWSRNLTKHPRHNCFHWETTHYFYPYLFFFFFFSIFTENILWKLRITLEIERSLLILPHSGSNPFKVMAESSSSGSPISTPKEDAPLLRPWILDHSSAALHPTETIRVIGENGNMNILWFLWLMRGEGQGLWGLLPHQWAVSSLPHQRVCNGEFKTPVHEECK